MSRPPRRFFGKCDQRPARCSPRTITLDGYAASHRAVRELKADGLLPAETKLRSSKSLNNLIEQDHRGVEETADRHDAGLQGLRDRGDYDRRYRIDASHPQGTIRTGTSGRPRSPCACSVECRAPSLKSRQYNTGRFPAPAICTRAVATRFNPDLKAKYRQLVEAGKPAKVALIAIMRKLIVLANALLKANRKWAPKSA